MTTSEIPVHHEGERPNSAAAEAQCPYCGQPISRKAYQKIRFRIEHEERARIAKVEQGLRDRFAREQQQASAKAQVEIAKIKKDAAAAAAAQIKAFRASQDATVAQRVQAAREAAETKLSEAIAAERTKGFAERVALEQKLGELQRKLAAKPAHQIGEPAETDLYDLIRAAFPEVEAKVTRVPKGKPGPDVIVDFLDERGESAGRVCLDSKNHKRWSTAFCSKAEQDRLNTGSDHAIVCSTVLPIGKVQAGIFIENGVICTTPSRVVVLLHILRRQILQVAALRLGANDRIEKTAQLYDFITGSQCVALFDQMNKVSRALIDLDTKEIAAHQITFRRRGDLIRQLQNAHGNLTARIDAIIAGAPTEISRMTIAVADEEP